MEGQQGQTGIRRGGQDEGRLWLCTLITLIWLGGLDMAAGQGKGRDREQALVTVQGIYAFEG